MNHWNWRKEEGESQMKEQKAVIRKYLGFNEDVDLPVYIKLSLHYICGDFEVHGEEFLDENEKELVASWKAHPLDLNREQYQLVLEMIEEWHQLNDIDDFEPQTIPKIEEQVSEDEELPF